MDIFLRFTPIMFVKSQVSVLYIYINCRFVYKYSMVKVLVKIFSIELVCIKCKTWRIKNRLLFVVHNYICLFVWYFTHKYIHVYTLVLSPIVHDGLLTFIVLIRVKIILGVPRRKKRSYYRLLKRISKSFFLS